MNRIYIFTGKGGVGKTSIAAAHARKSELQKKKTLLISTDMAHNLGDLFGITCGKDIVSLSEYLDILEVDPRYVMENEYNEMMQAIINLLPGEIGNSVDEIGMIPGMEELFSLLKINDLYKKEEYERIIVDCAPTGETLSLLKFPELLSWYMEKLFPVGKVAIRVLAPITRTFMQVELPGKEAMNDIERFYLKLYELEKLLKNPEITDIRIVAVPEKMVVEESRRNYMYMNLYGFNVDGIFVNRVLPDELDNPFFKQWKEIQGKYIKEIEEDFSHLTMCKIPWFDEEVKGIPAVERIALNYLPGDVFDNKRTPHREKFITTDEGYDLEIFLPNVNKDNLDVYKVNNTLVIKIDNFKRNVLLPDTMREYEISGAKVENDVLRFSFAKERRQL